MWHYSGAEDPMRTTSIELEDSEFESKIRHLTLVRENINHEGLVLPLGAVRHPLMVSPD